MTAQKSTKPVLHFLITAGPTREPLDPVRYLTNRSSGKMGYALANAAVKAGHKVTLISGPTSLAPPKKVHFFSVTTADEMKKEVLKFFKKADVIIKSAAVADYKPAKIENKKIKKNKGVIYLKLNKNIDILKLLGSRKKSSQTLVGFAAETDHCVENALAKLQRKKCDLLVLNDVSQKGIGFDSENNQVTLFSKTAPPVSFKKMTKQKLAIQLIKKCTWHHLSKKQKNLFQIDN